MLFVIFYTKRLYSIINPENITFENNWPLRICMLFYNILTGCDRTWWHKIGYYVQNINCCRHMQGNGIFRIAIPQILHYILCCIINRLRHECFGFVTRDWPTSIKVTFVSMVTWKVQTVWLTVGGCVSWRTLHLVIFKEKILMTKRWRMKNMQVIKYYSIFSLTRNPTSH